MHLLRSETQSLDEAEAAVDLAQTPADIVVLSFTDSDLMLVAAAARLREENAPSLRLAHIGRLKHPYSVDLYVEAVAAKAKFVLVRLLGGLDYWRYGIDELAAAARAKHFELAIIPGDENDDPRLAVASTLPADALGKISACFRHGGLDNIKALLDWIADRVHGRTPLLQTQALPAIGRFEAACHTPDAPIGTALLLFYRSCHLAGDVAPILALADALAACRLTVTALYVTSLKDEAVATELGEMLPQAYDIILNTTAFSARRADDTSILERADVPVLQVILAGSSEAQWQASTRGLSGADLAMNVVLPEMDGRLITRAISCKAEAVPCADLEFTPLMHKPLPSRVAYVAALAAAWADLRKTPPSARRCALVLSDYPAKGGRSGYAVGLDTPASVIEIAAILRNAGYDIGPLPAQNEIMARLAKGDGTAQLSLADYRAALSALPEPFVAQVMAQWGAPEDDPLAADGLFRFAVLRSGSLLVALQPERGRRDTRKAQYHDINLPPCHGYIAFYIWLRAHARIQALIHCGTHGTLEWLPGKAAALGEACAPEVVLGALPVIYPFIVNNPGEAAQAKRRIGAVTIGHMTPPLTAAGHHGAASALEPLFDEYAQADGVDPKRARLLAETILSHAKENGLLAEGNDDSEPQAALQRLDAWLCDLKDMRIKDGLHIFGQPPRTSPDEWAAVQAPLVAQCGEAERNGLLAALDGRFVAPGPGGVPARGRLDVLPTGRNIYSIDPRSVPTRTAWELGQRLANEVLARYAQDRGEWLRSIVIDLWASATMRTGGDDFAQALALLGVRPVWDAASTRVSGFEILPPASLSQARIDVTLRISGLFRDVFPMQIALFDQAVQAVAALDEPADINPLAAAARQAGNRPARIFGAAPMAYGLGFAQTIATDPTVTSEELGEAYLAASAYSYGLESDGTPASIDFSARVAAADAFVHANDLEGQDLLESDALIDHAGGFAAAARGLGADPVLYSIDTSKPEAVKVRSLREELLRALHGRAGNPRWIAGQMRHGHRGAAEIAETIDNLFALAALSDVVESRHFELLFEAICMAPEVRDFLIAANPDAARAIAARFEAAARRGFWQSRRNSSAACIAEIKELAEIKEPAR